MLAAPASIGLSRNGINSTTLRACAGEGPLRMDVIWHLTDAQLAFLVSEGVRILQDKARTQTFSADNLSYEMKKALRKIFEETDNERTDNY